MEIKIKQETLDYILEHTQDPTKLLDRDFQAWLHVPENRKIYQYVRSNQKAWLSRAYANTIDVNAEFRQFKSIIDRQRIRMVYRIFSLTAILIVGLGIGLTLLLTERSVSTGKQEIMTANESKVKLILENGEQIVLKDNINHLKVKDGTVISIDSIKGLSYQKERQIKEKPSYHTLQTPIGADYYVVLDDGTKVWMNCESTLRYPNHFDQDKRVVYLDGEAFFEVSKSETCPFIVITNNMKIQVTGTSFNVKAYKNVSFVHTTLIQGEVYVNDQKLIPSQQYILDRETHRSKIISVDPQFYIGWKSGVFVFKNQRLEDVMNDLSRWYGVQVFYMNEALKELRFSGNLGRYDSIDKVLEVIMEMDKIIITRQKSVITISNK